MEVKVTKEIPEFNPVKLSIMMETQEEFDLVYQVFNHAAVVASEVESIVGINYSRKINEDKLYNILYEAFRKLQAVK